jgi:DNA-binding transcriptional regulator GbsR (MarR family)
MPDPLAESKSLLVRRWGEMGGYWGISRTMAEIHALLFVSTDPLCTDDIMAQLHISRGNASMNLRALVDWGLIQRVHKLGDRKEYFQADTNVWHMFETIMRERRRREVEPIIATIDRCQELITGAEADTDAYRARLGELRGFLTDMSTMFELVLRFGRERVGELAAALATLTPAADSPPSQAAAPPASQRKTRGAARRPARRKDTR